MKSLNQPKIAILGAGNLGGAIARGLVAAEITPADHIYLTRRHPDKLESWKKQGYLTGTDNREAIKGAEYVFLCVQPKQLPDLLKELKEDLQAEQPVLISTITGVDIQRILSLSSGDLSVVRAMPNTAVAIRESMTCFCTYQVSEKQLQGVRSLFDALGESLVIDETHMKAATVLAASGIAFFLRYIRAATQGGIQMGFHAEEAQMIAMQTARGAASLLVESENHPETEIDKVTTPQGCTIAGLNEMEHQGLSSAVIKGLLASFEKINTIT